MTQSSGEIDRNSPRPHTHLNLPRATVRASSLHGVLLHFILEFIQEKTSLLPHKAIQGADVLNIKRWVQSLPLLLVGAAFRQNKTKPNNPSQEVPRTPRLLKVVCASAHDIKQGLVVGSKQVAPVEKIAEMDETLVGDCFHPVQGRAATRVVEYNPGMVQAALPWSGLIHLGALSFLILYKHTSTLGR